MTPGVDVIFRPEQIDQHLPRMRAVAEVGQVGEQPGGLTRAKPRDDLPALLQAQPAQQFDFAPRVHSGFHGFPAHLRHFALPMFKLFPIQLTFVTSISLSLCKIPAYISRNKEETLDIRGKCNGRLARGAAP